MKRRLRAAAWGLAVAVVAAASWASEQPALVIQLNQVALEAEGPKSAIVEAAGGDSTSGRFNVLRGDEIVQSGDLVALPRFSEWGEGRRYFKADFSSLTAPGRYRIEAVVGSDKAQSAAVDVVRQALFKTAADSLVAYFHASRWTNEADKHIRIYDTDRYVNVFGGWQDAGGDTGKYLSHLSFANYFNPQQSAMVTWVLAKSYDTVPDLYRKAGLDVRIIDEAFWGADFLHRVLDPAGYFYETVFDRWGEPGAERVVTGYEGLDGRYSTNYNAAFREGGGVAIAALARASMLAGSTGRHGEFTGPQYLADAEKAFDHLQANNTKYCDNGVENIIDDYTALLAATELYRATHKDSYLQAARVRAENLNKRMTPDGWFVSDGKDRPYYHGAEAGFPVVSLVYYLDIEQDPARIARARKTIGAALDYQLALNGKVANPYDYARQSFRIYKEGKLSPDFQEGFFMPHANETGYWWQGESARLASLAAAAILGGRLVAPDAKNAFGVRSDLATFAQHQVDWTLGRNPFGMCMLYGFGARNPPSAESAGVMVKGGISNGITGATLSDQGRGIVWAEGPDENNWRWLEQWLPHSTWFLLAVTAMAQEGTAGPP